MLAKLVCTWFEPGLYMFLLFTRVYGCLLVYLYIYISHSDITIILYNVI